MVENAFTCILIHSAFLKFCLFLHKCVHIQKISVMVQVIVNPCTVLKFDWFKERTVQLCIQIYGSFQFLAYPPFHDSLNLSYLRTMAAFCNIYVQQNFVFKLLEKNKIWVHNKIGIYIKFTFLFFKQKNKKKNLLLTFYFIAFYRNIKTKFYCIVTFCYNADYSRLRILSVECF